MGTVKRFVGVVLAVTAIYLPGTARVARAEWPRFGRPVVTAINGQQHAAVARDGAGGAIITWQDFRSPRVNTFAQHVLASGELDARWPVDGRSLLADPAALDSADGGQISQRIVSDGAGGAIVAWLDNRSPVTEIDVFAQHVLASGVVDPAWPANGAGLCVVEGVQNSLVLAPDGVGGAIAAWLDVRPGGASADIFAQHILSSGTVDPRWPVNGIAVSAPPGAQELPVIAEDGAGGAFVAWEDARDPNNLDVFAEHVLSTGTLDPAWPVDGLPVGATIGSQGRPAIGFDGCHGAIVAWVDNRSGTADHIFAQHVILTGVDPAWPANGRGISGATAEESRPILVTDGAGGAIVSWQAFNFNVAEYAQHVTAAGTVDPAWPAAGLRLSASELDETQGAIAADDAGGAIVAWRENFDVIVQHVLASGTLDPQYGATGRPVVALPSGQGDPAIVASGGGGAVVAWTDTRKGTDVDIYAMQVAAIVTTGVPDSTPPGLALRRPGPNPARGSVTLRFSLPAPAPARLTIFDASGRLVRVLASGAQSGGEHVLAWDLRDQAGHDVPSRVYFARLETEGHTLTEKLVTVR